MLHNKFSVAKSPHMGFQSMSRSGVFEAGMQKLRNFFRGNFLSYETLTGALAQFDKGVRRLDCVKDSTQLDTARAFLGEIKTSLKSMTTGKCYTTKEIDKLNGTLKSLEAYIGKATIAQQNGWNTVVDCPRLWDLKVELKRSEEKLRAYSASAASAPGSPEMVPAASAPTVLDKLVPEFTSTLAHCASLQDKAVATSVASCAHLADTQRVVAHSIATHRAMTPYVFSMPPIDSFGTNPESYTLSDFPRRTTPTAVGNTQYVDCVVVGDLIFRLDGDLTVRFDDASLVDKRAMLVKAITNPNFRASVEEKFPTLLKGSHCDRQLRMDFYFRVALAEGPNQIFIQLVVKRPRSAMPV